MEWLLFGLGIAAILWVGVALIGVIPLLLIVNGRFKPMAEGSARELQAAFGSTFPRQFLRERQFRFAGAVQGITRVAGWQDGKGRYVGVYQVGEQRLVDFVTRWSDDVTLTTGNSRDSLTTTPPAGAYMQGFHRAPAAELWRRHVAAEATIEAAEGVDRQDREASPLPFSECFNDAVRRSATHVLYRPWLWLLIPWGYFVTRFRWSDVPVEDQIRRGRSRPRSGMGLRPS